MKVSNYARPGSAPVNGPATPGGTGGTLGSVTDGATTVSPTNAIDFASGATVTDLGGGVAQVDLTAPAMALDDLTDVDAPSPAEGDALTWDGASDWVPVHALTEADVVAIITPDIYFCDSLTVNDGTLAAGTHTDLHAVGGTTVEIDETATTPGFDVEAAFSGVDGLTDVYVHGYYTGTHTVTVDLYNYDTTSWDTAITIPTGGTGMVLLHAQLTSGSPYFDGGGNSVVRFHHASAGNPTHRLYLDYLAISHVAGTAGVLALDDLSDVTITSVSDGEVLTYDSGTSEWINAAPSPASDIVDIPTAETDTSLVLAPDGAGGVEWVTPGAGPGGGALVLLEQHTANDTAANLDFTTFISSTYDEYMIEVLGVVPATSLAKLLMRCGTGAGPTWDSTAGHYAWNVLQLSSVGSGITGSQSVDYIRLSYDGTNTGDAASGSESGSWRFTNYGAGTIYPRLWGSFSLIYDSGYPSEGGISFGTYLQTTAVTGLQFLMSTGNMKSGTIRIYGIAKS